MSGAHPQCVMCERSTACALRHRPPVAAQCGAHTGLLAACAMSSFAFGLHRRFCHSTRMFVHMYHVRGCSVCIIPRARSVCLCRRHLVRLPLLSGAARMTLPLHWTSISARAPWRSASPTASRRRLSTTSQEDRTAHTARACRTLTRQRQTPATPLTSVTFPVAV